MKSLVLLLIVLCTSFFSYSQVSPAERAALIALFNSTDGPNWNRSTNWNTTTTVDTWHGITVSGGHVTELELEGNNLVGPLPTDLGDLQWLEIFNLARNKITGSIPDEIYSIIPMETIALHSNRTINGIISPDIGNLQNLKIYSLHENQLSGAIPIEIATLPYLESLSIYKNNLTGSIPPELGNLTTLKALRIGNNDYNPGVIPAELGNLVNLTSLWFDKSNLIGTLPPELGNLVLLSSFYMHNNAITGPIPPEYGNLTEAYWFLWGNNQFTGSIPPELGNWTKCRFFTLSNNQLSGPIPAEFGNMANMEQLNLGFNELTGAIPNELGNLSKITQLVLSNNQLTGNIPSSLTGLTDLYQLHLSNNQLSGSIPDFTSISTLGFDSNSLEFLYLDENHFQFGDLENEFPTYESNINSLKVNPQAKLDATLTLNETEGDNVTLSVTPPSGTQLHYSWYKNNLLIAGAPDSPTFALTNLQMADAGTYHCEITSEIVTDLSLQRHDIILNINAAPPSGPRPFITTWKTDNPGTSANNQITIPTDPYGTYNYSVDWGDGNVSTNVTEDITHTYTTPGTYTVSISGTFPRIYFGANASDPSGRPIPDREKLMTIEQWGDNQWGSMKSAFWGCINLEGNYNDKPDLSNVKSTAGMFASNKKFNHTVSDWDVSNVEDMNHMFYENSIFNQDIGDWDVSHVKNTSSMFVRAYRFNQDIGRWNMSNVELTNHMFYEASNFNQDIGNWDVSNVTTMNAMFLEAIAFNQDIGSWNVDKVTTFSHMFTRATSFNQDIGNWNTISVRDMSYMFGGATAFNQDIGRWDTRNVTTMRVMFNDAQAFNQNLNNWNTSNVLYMDAMFSNAIRFDQNIGNWNVTKVRDARRMFDGVTLSISNYDALLIGWNTKNLKPNITFSGGNSQYCAGKSARENMVMSDAWAISDGGFAGVTADSLTPVSTCGSYKLPALSPNNQYFTEINRGGTELFAGHNITVSQQLYIYTEIGTAPNTCSDENLFNITITAPPVADNPADVIECDSYTLPALSPDNEYYTEASAGGMKLNAGDRITTSQMLYVYKEINGCSNENKFFITIDKITSVDMLENVSECESYVLPVLTNGNYFTESGGLGTELFANEIITETQTVYVYFSSGSCSDESDFIVTIDPTICEDSTEEEEDDDDDDDETCEIEFPKFITPNGDGFNDSFVLAQNNCGLTGELRIYDRYGKLVFQTQNLQNSWDGTMSGTPLPASDYWYQFIDNTTGKLVTKHFALKR